MEPDWAEAMKRIGYAALIVMAAFMLATGFMIGRLIAR